MEVIIEFPVSLPSALAKLLSPRTHPKPLSK